MNTASTSPRGFTLLEVLIALMIFGIAVVALVGAINGMGTASVEARRTQEIVARLESLMTEVTREPPPPNPEDMTMEKKFSEGGVDYRINRAPYELTNEDEQKIDGIYKVTALARWKDGGHEEQMSTETLVYPPLYAPGP